MVNASTRKSICALGRRGTPSGAKRIKALAPQYPSRSPATPPHAASTALSLRNCVARRDRPAPSAWRIATSRSRAAARANSRFAIFTQAINSTSSTAPSSTQSVRLSDGPMIRVLHAVELPVRSCAVGASLCHSGAQRSQFRLCLFHAHSSFHASHCTKDVVVPALRPLRRLTAESQRFEDLRLFRPR